jgi:hypothetical protein
MRLDLEKGRNLVMDAKRTFFLLLTVGLLLAGCGYNSAFTTTGAPPTTTGSATTSTAVVRLTPGATSTATTISQGAAGQGVIVQTSAALYHPGQSIVVVILNHTTRTIVFANHQSNCTVVLLQVQAGSLWQSVALCRLMTVTKLLALGAGKSLSVTLSPAPSAWSAGTYRIAFRYASNSLSDPGSFQNIFSSLFRIR